MRVLYFDCFSGICGDMALGALVDAGLPLATLQSELAKLKLPGFGIRAERVVKSGFAGTRVHVDTAHDHTHRGLSDIVRIIDGSDMEAEVKSLSTQAFTRLAEAEARVHNKPVDAIYFHEVGALDAIVDIVGAMVGIRQLGIDAVYSSRVHVGSGFVRAAHGEIPVPAPGTLALLEGVPIYSRGIEAELATPTGAAILTTLARGFGDLPLMTVERVGYGVGGHELPIPNMLRVIIGVMETGGYEHDTVVLLETNLDDMNPEHFEYVAERLRAQRALEVYFTPVIMKKSRPATMLSVLAQESNVDSILAILFAETTTLGVRVQRVERRKLAREVRTVRTRFGDIRVKIARHNDKITNIAPEYDDCARIASSLTIPLKDVYDEARRAAQEQG